MGWFFTQNFFGMAALVLPIYGVSWFLRKRFARFPHPLAISGITFLLVALTLPSYARYQFEREVLSAFENNPQYRMINKAYYHDIREPLTLIRPPLGFIHAMAPANPLESGVDETGMKRRTFQRIQWQFGKDPEVSLEEANCTKFSVLVSISDAKRIFRYATQYPKEMSKADQKLFCETDWSYQVELLREGVVGELMSQLEK